MNFSILPAFTFFSVLYIFVFTPVFLCVYFLFGGPLDPAIDVIKTLLLTVIGIPETQSYTLAATLFSALVSALVAAITAADKSQHSVLIIMTIMLLLGLASVAIIEVDLQQGNDTELIALFGDKIVMADSFITEVAKLAAAQLGVLLGVSAIKFQEKRGE